MGGLGSRARLGQPSLRRWRRRQLSREWRRGGGSRSLWRRAGSSCGRQLCRAQRRGKLRTRHVSGFPCSGATPGGSALQRHARQQPMRLYRTPHHMPQARIAAAADMRAVAAKEVIGSGDAQMRIVPERRASRLRRFVSLRKSPSKLCPGFQWVLPSGFGGKRSAAACRAGRAPYNTRIKVSISARPG